MGSQGWPGRFGGESGEVLVGLVERCDGLGSEKLFGGDVEAVGVALNSVEEPRSGVAEFSSRVVAEVGRRHERGCAAGSRSGCGVRRFGWMMVCGSPSPTTWR